MFIKYASEQLDLKKIYKNTNQNSEGFSTDDIVKGRLVIGECGNMLAIGYLTGIEYKEGVIFYNIENAELGNSIFRVQNAHRVNVTNNDIDMGLPITASIGKFYSNAIGYVLGCNGNEVQFLDRNSDDAIYSRPVSTVCALEPYKEEK